MAAMKYILALIALLAVAEVASADNSYECSIRLASQEPMYCISMIHLLGNPEKFDNKKVRITGYMNLEFEGNALYVRKDDFENMMSENSIWLDLTNTKRPEFNSAYAIIEGTFLAGNRGHMGMFSGALTQITRIDKSLSRADIETIQNNQR